MTARRSGEPSATAFSKRKTLVLIGVCVVIGLLSVTAYFNLFRQTKTPEIPLIASAGLDVTVARLLSQLETRVRQAPRNAKAWGELGMMLRANNFPREATVCLRHAQSLDPAEPRWPYHLAQCLMATDETDALAWLERAVTLAPPDLDHPRLEWTQSLVERGQWEEARTSVKTWLANDPENAAAKLLEAQIAFAHQEWETSARSLAPCLTNRFTARRAHALLGQVYTRLGREEDATKVGQIVSMLPEDDFWPNPLDDELQSYRVSRRHLIEFVPVLLARNQNEEAARLTAELLKHFPQSPEGWLFQGRLDYLARNWPAAEKAFQRHLELEPNSVDGLMQLGQLRLRQRQPLDAADQFKQAILLKPDAHLAHYQLGEALLRSGDTNAAIASWREAIRNEPSFMESYLRLAKVLSTMGRREEALEQIVTAMGINPADMRVQEAMEALQGP